MDKIEKIKFLVERLNQANYAYYVKNEEIMSNFEYDKLYDELVDLEKESGIILSNSPTQHVGFNTVSSLEKVRHEKPMLSLDKTKNPDDLVKWLGNQKGILGWKLDGLTVVLTYNDGKLISAVTRGTGEIGENITHNISAFQNVPGLISFKGRLVLRGEAIIRYSDFERINSLIPEVESRYKNPRNLCSGTVRSLSSKTVFERKVFFIAFTLVSADGDRIDFGNSKYNQLEWLKSQGFDTVESYIVTRDDIVDRIKWFQSKIKDTDQPSDGLVLTYDDIGYSESLGTTSKFPRDSIAFKWQDEEVETTITGIEWNTSRTGLITPVAVFEPVEIEGTTVTRASLHNVSILEDLQISVGDRVLVYKANLIIPQVSANLTKKGIPMIPENCPSCGKGTEIKISEDNVKTLYCTNPECPAKHLRRFVHFVSREAMDIAGLSEATIEKFTSLGILKRLSDLYRIENHKDTIIKMDGFGEKSFENLLNAINKSKSVPIHKFLYALGIPLVGESNAKAICKAYDGDFSKIRTAKSSEISSIYGIGDALANSFETFFTDENNNSEIDDLLSHVTLIYEKQETSSAKLTGLTFVVTGTLSTMTRNEVEKLIEDNGGKVLSGVSKKLNYLICGENAGSKLSKAKELGIRVISEKEFLDMLA